MSREIKFRVWAATDDGMKMVYLDEAVCDNGLWFSSNTHIDDYAEAVMQFTGLKDKNGKEIYAGDIIRWRNPVRTTQTHTGDNIPNGSYTEPMEPGIITHEEAVEFKDGCFGYGEREDSFVPLNWVGMYWDLESIKEAISYGRPGRFIWDDPEEGDLQYLMEECAKVKTTEELVEYLSGIEIIGNIYETPELIN